MHTAIIKCNPRAVSHTWLHTHTHTDTTQEHPGMSTDSHSSRTSTYPHDLQAWRATLFPLEERGADLVQMLQVIQLKRPSSHDRRRREVRERYKGLFFCTQSTMTLEISNTTSTLSQSRQNPRHAIALSLFLAFKT